MKHDELINKGNSHTDALRQTMRVRWHLLLCHVGLAGLIAGGDAGWRWLGRNKAADTDVLTIRMEQGKAVAWFDAPSSIITLSNCHLIRAEGVWLIRKP